MKHERNDRMIKIEYVDGCEEDISTNYGLNLLSKYSIQKKKDMPLNLSIRS